jgi:hypothetical protein
MSACKPVSDPRSAARIFVALAAGVACDVGCSARTLVAVDPCDDAGDAGCSMLGDAPAQIDTAKTTLRQGLIGLWHFDESAGGQTAVDSSGNGNDGTLTGLDASSVWASGGRLGNALAVNGQGYVLVPLSSSIASIVDGVTMSAWVYFDGTVADYGTAISRQIGTSIVQFYHLAIWQADGEPSLFISPNLSTAAAHPTWSVATAPKTWTHLAGTYDGKTATLYVDGSQVASLPIAGKFATDTTPLILGGNGNNQTISEYFPGRIDEIALYNRALDASEIQQLARAMAF